MASVKFLLIEKLLSLVFYSGCHAAADMALGLVFIQHRFGLMVKRGVYALQTLGQVLMYCGFADAEFFRGGADGGSVFYYVSACAASADL